jgi:hypothetical protein
MSSPKNALLLIIGGFMTRSQRADSHHGNSVLCPFSPDQPALVDSLGQTGIRFA